MGHRANFIFMEKKKKQQTYPYSHINSGTKIYIKSPKLRKAEPIQLYQIGDKGKTLKKSKHVLFIIFSKFEAKFDKLCDKKKQKNRKIQFLIY